VSEADEKRERIRGRIAASEERLQRESSQLPALPHQPARKEEQRPETIRALLRDHPLLVLAAGAGAGLVLGSLLPKRAGSKVSARALGLAATGAELALAFSRNARNAAEESAREGLHRLDEGTAPLRRNASRAVGQAGRNARSTGVKLASEAIRLATRLRK